jgi:TolB protein
LLQQSWDETRETIRRHPRATAWGGTALVLVLLAVAIGVSRSGGDPKAKTTVRADQSAASLNTPTTFFGNDLVVDPNHPKGTGSQSGQDSTGITLRNGDGLHLYTGTVPDYSGGSSPTTTTARGGSPETTAPSGGGNNGGTTATTAYPAAVFGGNRIAYVTNGQTWTVNPDGTDARFVANSAFYPAWAPSHSAIAVVDGQNPGGILSYITPGGGRYALTPAPTGSGNGDSRPTWSPDGVRLAFGRIDFGGSGGYSSIWVINKDGQNPHRISIAGCFTADPTWSPDGSHIAFWSSRDHCSSGDNIGSYELYVMNSDGTGVKRLGTAINSGAPAFSPDGTRIAFASDRDGNFDIWVMDADGTGETRVTSLSGDETDPTWSPDGTRIAFSRNNTIYTMKADGTDAPKAVVAGSQPSWS